MSVLGQVDDIDQPNVNITLADFLIEFQGLIDTGSQFPIVFDNWSLLIRLWKDHRLTFKPKARSVIKLKLADGESVWEATYVRSAIFRLGNTDFLTGFVVPHVKDGDYPRYGNDDVSGAVLGSPILRYFKLVIDYPSMPDRPVSLIPRDSGYRLIELTGTGDSSIGSVNVTRALRSVESPATN